MRLWTYEAFAAGAEVVSYFRWRQAPFAQEQMHEALLLPNSEPNEAYHVVARVSQELSALDAKAQTARSPIALIFDYESAWAWNIEPHGLDFSYFELVLAFYGGLRRLGLSVDIVPPTQQGWCKLWEKVALLFCWDRDPDPKQRTFKFRPFSRRESLVRWLM